MIFLDTSVIYALADAMDSNHSRATSLLRAALGAGHEILTHNYVLVESMALLQRRLGLDACLKFATTAGAFEIEWVDRTTHAEAVRRLARSTRSDVSLVDHVSFIVMRARSIDEALAFDRDFVDAGFRIYDG